MKKFFCTAVMSALFCCLMACSNSSSSDANQDEIDITNIETLTVPVSEDAQNSTTVEFKSNVESKGFGRCLKSGCNCKSFEGRGETCRNCGHAYKKHY